MPVETEKENVCINQIIGQKRAETFVEGDVIVNDVKPDVLNIISANGIACVYKKEVMDGKIRIDGSVNTYIIYLADSESGNIRSLNTVLDFTQIIDIDNCRPDMILNESVSVKNIDYRIINERKISIKASLDVEAKLYSNEQTDIITGITNFDDMQTLSNNKCISSLVGEGNTRVYAKDTLSVDSVDDLAEIMNASLKIVNKEVKLSYNKVLAKAETEIWIMYLTEDNRINNVSTKIPIMGFIDIENINDNSICDVDYKLKNLIIKPNNGETHSIYVEAEMELSCFAYESKEINLIEDMYSISQDVEFNKKNITTIAGKQNIRQDCNIREQISMPEVGSNKIYCANTKPIINDTKVMNGKILYSGELSIEFLYEVSNGMEAKRINLPFNFEAQSDLIEANNNVDTDLTVEQDNFVIVSDGNIEANITMQFNIGISKTEKISIIDDLEVKECRQNNIYSMIIYFVKPGDTLWKIAKKFRSTVEDIARVNGIEDENKIYVGQQLYIPKYIKKRIAV